MGHLSCFHVLTTVNNASVNTGVHIPFQISIFVFFGSRIAGPYDSSIFNFLQNLHAVSIEISHSVMSNSLRPHGYSPLGSSIHGISPVRILEWVAISFSRGSSWPRYQTTSPASLRHWQAGSLPLSQLGRPSHLPYLLSSATVPQPLDTMFPFHYSFSLSLSTLQFWKFYWPFLQLIDSFLGRVQSADEPTQGTLHVTVLLISLISFGFFLRASLCWHDPSVLVCCPLSPL